jgi:hypothetical protein
VLANLLGAEALVSLDDDEVIEDADFLERIAGDLEDLGGAPRFSGWPGSMSTRTAGFRRRSRTAPWALFWPKLRCMNQTFAGLLERR